MLIRFFVLLAIYLDKVCTPFSIKLFCMVMQGTSFIVLGIIWGWMVVHRFMEQKGVCWF